MLKTGEGKLYLCVEYHRHQAGQAQAACPTQNGLRETRGGSIRCAVPGMTGQGTAGEPGPQGPRARLMLVADQVFFEHGGEVFKCD